ncbi:MAG: hypothetical protein K6B68_06965 [Eubacterium sp.]|nr:hypothetical protein [Eubacterium sp.]
MFLKDRKKISCLLFAAMLGMSGLTGCGSKSTEVTEYGLIQSADAEDAGNDNNDNKSAENQDAIVEQNAGKCLSDMLGGSDLEFTKSFTLDGKSASIDVAYHVNEADSLSIYNVTTISEQDVKEADIVKNLLGDSAVALNSESRQYLNTSFGDSPYIIYCCQYVSYHNGGNFNLTSHRTWVDEAMYYIHTYEGTKNNITYQLMVSYSQKYKEMAVAFYPKNVGEIVGDETLIECGTSSPDGIYYTYQGSLKQFKLDEIMADRPNACTLSDEELINYAKDTLKNDIYVDFPEEAISLYANVREILIPEDVKPTKGELVFVNDDIEKSENLSGAIRDGYEATVMYSLCNQKVMADTEIIDDRADEIQYGQIDINNSGVLGFIVTSKYIFGDTVTDNANILSFDKAMEAFVNGAMENLKATDIKKADDTILFDSANLVYFPVAVEGSTSQYNLVPAWSLEAENAKKQTIVRVLINATDGSYITSIYEPEND